MADVTASVNFCAPAAQKARLIRHPCVASVSIVFSHLLHVRISESPTDSTFVAIADATASDQLLRPCIPTLLIRPVHRVSIYLLRRWYVSSRNHLTVASAILP